MKRMATQQGLPESEYERLKYCGWAMIFCVLFYILYCVVMYNSTQKPEPINTRKIDTFTIYPMQNQSGYATYVSTNTGSVFLAINELLTMFSLIDDENLIVPDNILKGSFIIDMDNKEMTLTIEE